MAYLAIELARIIDEDRYREAERHRHINKSPVIREWPVDPVQILVRRLQCLAKREQRVATEQPTRTLAGLS
jgi:hypothetical protein